MLCFHRKLINVILLTILFLWLFASTTFAQSCPLYPSPHLRVGFNVATDGDVDVDDYDAPRLSAGWYHNYRFQTDTAHPGGLLYHQMVRGARRTSLEEIKKLFPRLGLAVDANPGQTWVVGNEPDRYGQDELTPRQYADFYHQIYTFIKQRDPSSRIAVGGIVQPTSIRLRYLNQVLAAYEQSYGQPLPTDLWHIHNFMLPENCGWGAGIPPGLDEHIHEGIPCPPTLDAHADLNTFRQQIRNFRQWMNSHGYRNYPLIISEYGILLSKYHGFTHPRVRDFMLGTFDFMLNTTDSQTGYPADGNRLVQEFGWFSLNYYEFDLQTYIGLNGNLFDHDSRQITDLGLDFENYLKGITVKTVDLAMRTLSADPSQPQSHTPVALQALFVNEGSVAAQDVTVRFWNGDPRAGGQLIGSAPSISQVLPVCATTQAGKLVWMPTQPGVYTIFAELTATNHSLESNRNNNYASVNITVADNPITTTPTATAMATATPTVTPTPLATASPSPTATPTTQLPMTATPTASQTATTAPTPTPTLSSTPTVPASATATATPTAPTSVTATATPTAPASATATATPTAPVSATATATASATTTTAPLTATPTGTDTPTTTTTATPVIDATVTGTATSLPTPTVEPTASVTLVATETASATPTVTVPPDLTATPTSLAPDTPTPTQTVTSTATPTATQIATPTPTPTATSSATLAATPTTIVSGNASVALNITVGATTLTAGEKIRYQFHYANNSEQVVTNLILRLQIPDHTTFHQPESSSGWICSAATQQAACHLAIGDLAVDTTGVADFVVTSEESLAESKQVTLAVTVEGNQQVLTTANATVTLIGERGFVQYLPFVPK